jgi:hypothetical protein
MKRRDVQSGEATISGLACNTVMDVLGHSRVSVTLNTYSRHTGGLAGGGRSSRWLALERPAWETDKLSNDDALSESGQRLPRGALGRYHQEMTRGGQSSTTLRQSTSIEQVFVTGSLPT